MQASIPSPGQQDPTVDFLLRCNKVLDGFRVEQGSIGFHDLINLLHVSFRSEMTGVLRTELGITKVVYAHPHPNPFVFKNTELARWIAEGGRNELLSTGVQELERSTRKFASFWPKPMAKPNKPAAPEATYLYSPFLVVFKIPRIYPNHEKLRHCYLVFVYSDIGSVFETDQLDLQFNHLSSLIDTWAWGMTHHRSKLWDCFRELDSISPLNPGAAIDPWANLESATTHLGSLLSVTEIVKIAALGYRLEKDVVFNVPDILPLTLGCDLERWKMESPPNWPPSLIFKPARDVVSTLIYWSRWRDRTLQKSARIGQYRAFPKTSVPENYLENSDSRFGKRLACYRHASKEMLKLRSLAMRSIAEHASPLKFKGNLLGLYFFAQSLDSPERSAYWQSMAPSNMEVLERLSNISCLANHLLAQFPVDSDTIQALVGTLSEFLHHKLGVPGRISLRQHLFQAARVEPTLHVLKKFYRDHFYHAIEVAFLGHFLLELRDWDGNPLWRRVASHMKGPRDKKRVFQQWYLAALLHDFGYIMDVHVGIRSMFRFFEQSDLLKKFGDDLDKAMVELSKNLGDENFMGYKLEHQPGKDHGVIGAKHLRSLLEHIALDDPSVVPLDYEPAIDAISRHNSRVHKVRFREDPLSALLILCDTVQEWSRPRLDYNLAPLEVLSWLRNPDTSEHDRMGPLRQIELDVRYQTGRAGGYFELERSDTLNIRLCFDERIGRNHGVFQMWLDASANLQRLDLDGFGLHVNLEFETPVMATRDPATPFESQFYRLRDAARETHMDFLEKWFPNRRTNDKSGLTNGSVTYYGDAKTNGDSTGGNERLILHLNNLAKEKLITRDISEFHQHLRKWKRYTENLDYLGEYALPDYPT